MPFSGMKNPLSQIFNSKKKERNEIPGQDPVSTPGGDDLPPPYSSNEECPAAIGTSSRTRADTIPQANRPLSHKTPRGKVLTVRITHPVDDSTHRPRNPSDSWQEISIQVLRRKRTRSVSPRLISIQARGPFLAEPVAASLASSDGSAPLIKRLATSSSESITLHDNDSASSGIPYAWSRSSYSDNDNASMSSRSITSIRRRSLSTSRSSIEMYERCEICGSRSRNCSMFRRGNLMRLVH